MEFSRTTLNGRCGIYQIETTNCVSPYATANCDADGKRLASASYDQTVKVWDARPWTPELRAKREALSLIHSLRAQGQSPSEWLAAIAADQTLTEPVRQRALQFAREGK